jgi:hypothetical protein
MANEIKEEETLKPETEVETEEENEDETIVPPLEEKPTEEDIKELKTISKDVVEAIDTEEETKETETPAPIQPKPVDGETPREKALRMQIQELREKIRSKDEVIKIAQPLISNEEYEALKETYDDDELQKFEKLFDVIGKKKGYVKAEDVYKDKGQDTLNSFLNKHPEYKPENDPQDTRWNIFFKVLERDYNRVGKSPTELAKLFEKVNRDVLEELGETDKKVISSSNQRNAEIQKIKSISHTGGVKIEISKKSNAPTDPNIRKMFKDFDDEDF